MHTLILTQSHKEIARAKIHTIDFDFVCSTLGKMPTGPETKGYENLAQWPGFDPDLVASALVHDDFAGLAILFCVQEFGPSTTRRLSAVLPMENVSLYEPLLLTVKKLEDAGLANMLRGRVTLTQLGGAVISKVSSIVSKASD